MSAEIIPFDFEEQAVRVVMRGDDPWFVAAEDEQVIHALIHGQAHCRNRARHFARALTRAATGERP